VQFVRSKSAYLICFQHDSVRSSFNSFVVNVGSYPHRLRWACRPATTNYPGAQSAMLK